MGGCQRTVPNLGSLRCQRTVPTPLPDLQSFAPLLAFPVVRPTDGVLCDRVPDQSPSLRKLQSFAPLLAFSVVRPTDGKYSRMCPHQTRGSTTTGSTHCNCKFSKVTNLQIHLSGPTCSTKIDKRARAYGWESSLYTSVPHPSNVPEHDMRRAAASA